MALSRYCLDTSAYSHFKRGEARVVELIDSAEWVGMPLVVVGELWLGFVLGGHLQQNATELEEFLHSPVVEMLPVDLEVARAYGEIAASLRHAGTPLPTNDIWVAASAARSGATVLTFDDHFRSITRVGSVVLSPRP